MFKNVPSQSVTLYAVDATTGLPKTGDSANMVFYVSKDDGTVTAVASASGVPTECDSTNAKGDYKIALSQAETNADKLRFSGKSTTANVVVVPQTIYTAPANFTATAIDSSGRVNVDKTGYKLASDGMDQVTIEAGINARQALSLIGAACAGVATGLDTTTVTFAAMGLPSVPRINSSVNFLGNRLAITLTPPA
jgi:hypothetical protein